MLHHFIKFQFFLILTVLSVVVLSIQMNLQPGDIRCIGQELDQLDLAVFALSATSKVKDQKQKVFCTITDPEDGSVYDGKITIGAKRKEVEYKIEKGGLYEMCFELEGGKSPVRIFFHSEYKPHSADGQDLSRKVGKDEIPSLESQLQTVKKNIEDISEVIEHAKKQEMSLKDAGESTSNRIQWFSILSMVILLSTSIWQIIYLRSFFVSKKLL